MLFLTFFGVKTHREKKFFICLVFFGENFSQFFFLQDLGKQRLF